MGRRGRSRVPGVLGLAPTLDPLGWAGGPLLPTPPELGEIYGQAARLVVLQRMRPALLQVRLMMADQWCRPVWLIDVRHSVVYQSVICQSVTFHSVTCHSVNYNSVNFHSVTCHSVISA